MRASTFFVFGILLSTSAFGQSLRLGPDASIDTINGMERSIKGIECRPVKEIPGTLTCLTENEELLRQLMGRVSMYVEGAPAKSLVAQDDPKFLGTPQANYAGHDIQSEDMEEFFAASAKGCKTNAKFCLSDLEIQLKALLSKLTKERKLKRYVVLAVAGYTGYMANVLSHEYLHARFFLNEDYRKKVKNFWLKKVSKQDRIAIREALGDTYNLEGANGEFLLLNEFQAYVLQNDAIYDQLGMSAMNYGDALRKAVGLPAIVRPQP